MWTRAQSLREKEIRHRYADGALFYELMESVAERDFQKYEEVKYWLQKQGWSCEHRTMRSIGG